MNKLAGARWEPFTHSFIAADTHYLFDALPSVYWLLLDNARALGQRGRNGAWGPREELDERKTKTHGTHKIAPVKRKPH